MNMIELYDQKIIDLEKEITQLKTAHVKTASTISTMNKPQTLNFILNDVNTMASSQRAIITLTASENMIGACYLANQTPTSLNGRQVNIQRVFCPQNKMRFDVWIYTTSADDYNTLAGGGTINLTYDFNLIASSDFTISVEYKNINGGTA